MTLGLGSQYSAKWLCSGQAGDNLVAAESESGAGAPYIGPLLTDWGIGRRYWPWIAGIL